MKKIILCLIATVASLACSNAQKKEFSKESLSKQLVTTENEKISFNDILHKQEGKVTVIEIWASWCGDCVKAMPKVKEMQAQFPGADYVFISMDKDFDKWKIGIAKHELVGKHYWATDGMKGEFGKSINLDWIPRYIVIGRQGEILLYKAVETDFDKIYQQLSAALFRNVKFEKADTK